MTDNEYIKTRKTAADALIYWAKTDMRQFTMRDAVNNYLEASGANLSHLYMFGLNLHKLTDTCACCCQETNHEVPLLVLFLV